MGLIKEPLNVDFFVEPKPLTEKEKAAISSYIRAYKLKTKSRPQSRKKKKVTA